MLMNFDQKHHEQRLTPDSMRQALNPLQSNLNACDLGYCSDYLPRVSRDGYHIWLKQAMPAQGPAGYEAA
jgi:hypothetical protein